MQKDIIHLKHTPSKQTLIKLERMAKSNRDSYMSQSANSTLCWTSIHEKDITVTDDRAKVTCKKCLKQISKGR